MIAILHKEISAFFNSLTGYLIIGIFLLISGLFLWVFDGPYNIPNSGFASLSPFFKIAPWLFVVIIPAITMRSISEEQRQGTLELLLTKPYNALQLILGKYLGAFILVLGLLIPTLVYVIAVFKLGNPQGNLDIGVTIGSYVGLLFLGACFVAIGIFASSVSSSQITAFLLGVAFSLLLYFGFTGFANYISPSITSDILHILSLQSHYDSISRGVIDTRDIIYFLSIIFLFVYLTKLRLDTHR